MCDFGLILAFLLPTTKVQVEDDWKRWQSKIDSCYWSKGPEVMRHVILEISLAVLKTAVGDLC